MTEHETCNISEAPSSQTTTSGPVWSEVVVGVSTVQELVAQFGSPKFIRTRATYPDLPTACWHIYDKVSFWVADDIVIGIQLTTFGEKAAADDLPHSVEAMKDLYGRPNIVSWSSVLGPNYRVLVWINEGVVANAFLGGGSPRITSILYFSSMSEIEFRSSVFAQLISDNRPTSTDVIDTLPRDPFDWDENHP